MKTLLPEPDLTTSAECLDDRRLQRQRADIAALLRKLDEEPPSDNDHHAVKMWRGNEEFLIKYGMVVCMEFQARGNRDNTLQKIMDHKGTFENSSSEPPEWWGDQEFHDSHKSYLLRGQPSHYRQFWPDLVDELPLIWPRSPEKGRKDKEKRDRERLIKKALKLKEKAEVAIEKATHAAAEAGLDPETMEEIPEDEIETVYLGTPDEEMLNL